MRPLPAAAILYDCRCHRCLCRLTQLQSMQVYLHFFYARQNASSRQLVSITSPRSKRRAGTERRAGAERRAGTEHTLR